MYRTPGIQKGPVDSHTRRLGGCWDGGRGGCHMGAGMSGGRVKGGGGRDSQKGDILLVSQLKQLCSGRSGPVLFFILKASKGSGGWGGLH